VSAPTAGPETTELIPSAPAPAGQPDVDPRFDALELDASRFAGLPMIERRRVPRSPRTQLFVTLAHWSMTILLALSLLSGMRLGWGYLESRLGGQNGWWGAILAAVSPTATLFGVNLISLHVALAFLMLLVAGVYVGYLVRSRTTARLRVTGKDLQNLSTGVRARRFWRDKPALWCANVIVYWLFFACIVTMVVTGVAMYRLEWGLAALLGGYPATRLAHGVAAYSLLPLTVLHVLFQWFFGRFWAIFKAQFYRPHVRAGLVSLAVIVPVVGGVYLWNDVPTTLTVKRISPQQAPRLDGEADEPVWHEAHPVVIRTVKGVNEPHDHVDVTVKALHDGQNIYFLFQWNDPDASFKRYPLQKTAQGWKVLQTAFERADENVYYEDKLSAYFTDVRNGSCAATCHVGAGPQAARNEKHGLHYTKGEIGDVWHWKSVRTNHMGAAPGEPGYMDDQHFRAPDPLPTKPTERYTGGYFVDPSPGGGYAYNFEKLDPKKPLAETLVRPKMLPARHAVMLSTDPTESDHDGTWWIHKAQGVPYTAAADTYPVGALIPNIIIEPFQGDRADIRAQARWRLGRWTLETRRVLDTKSKYDVAFNFERPVYLSVATYNRTQTRHGEHIRPVRVVLEK
jgi:cytochrome b subunit of formate dehydrogenase